MTEAEDRKPRSDEARSAYDPETTSGFALPAGLTLPRGGGATETSGFTVPEGLGTPQPPADGKEGSAFGVPGTHGGLHSPPAFTPATGVPAVSLVKDGPWQDRMRTMLRMPVSERPAPEPAQKPEEGVPAVPRVLDLTLRIGELLLAGGEGAEDVEAAMLSVCRSYGLDRSEPIVTFTLLTVSHQPSLVDHPVTASRTVRRRGSDYTRLTAVYRLVADLSDPGTAVSLEEAYRRLAEIRRNRHPYPSWVLTSAAGLLAGAAAVLVGGDLLVFVAAVLGAMLGDRLAWLCAGRGLPEFYQFMIAAMPPAAIGVALTLAGVHVNASAVITGGLFALLPGRALVAGVQDGLTGFYITASARLLEVMYLFVGIVVGVLVAEAANRAEQDFEHWRARGQSHLKFVRDLGDAITPEWAARLKPLPNDGAAPAFLVGFPRSGTTLLDTFLLGHPETRVLEEVPLISAVESALGDMRELPERSPAELKRARDAYVAQLASHTGAGFSGLVIDKMPLNMVAAPYLFSIFPDAPFIFAQRHPCDAVLGCFMQSFAPNAGMACFLEIQTAAQFYDAAMRMWTRSREALSLKVHTVVYEQLVADPEAALRPLIEFLNLEWRDELLDHRATAKARSGIGTPSYNQVTQPLSRAASGRWKRYERQLEPVLPILLPWAERLGYRD